MTTALDHRKHGYGSSRAGDRARGACSIHAHALGNDPKHDSPGSARGGTSAEILRAVRAVRPFISQTQAGLLPQFCGGRTRALNRAALRSLIRQSLDQSSFQAVSDRAPSHSFVPFKVRVAGDGNHAAKGLVSVQHLVGEIGNHV